MVPDVSDHEQTFGMQAVTRLTGLSASRLRQWERRYQLVRPLRLANGYRAYTREQVALLRAVARLLAAGHEIGDLVWRPRAELIIEAGTGCGLPPVEATLLLPTSAGDLPQRHWPGSGRSAAPIRPT